MKLYLVFFLLIFTSMSLTSEIAKAGCRNAYLGMQTKESEYEVQGVETVGGSAVGFLVTGLISSNTPLAVAVGTAGLLTGSGVITSEVVSSKRAAKMIRLLDQSQVGIELGFELQTVAKDLGLDLKSTAALVRSLDERNIFCMDRIRYIGDAIDLLRMQTNSNPSNK